MTIPTMTMAFASISGYFNSVVETANENSVENLVEEIEKEYGEIPVVRKIRTNNRKVICVK